ncbi:MAG: hypothetical protein V3U76_17380 [Granulosicoccus sp.]
MATLLNPMPDYLTSIEDGRPAPAINARIARQLWAFAELIEGQGANHYRVQAYKRASITVRSLDQPVDKILSLKGRQGLIDLPTIGVGIASAIAEMIMTGHWSQLDRLKGEHSPEQLFKTIPGVGNELAERFSDELHLETLEDLEVALHTPETCVKGLGPRRKEAIIAVLTARLGSSSATATFYDKTHKPPLQMVLEVDSDYRKAATAGSLHLIAPKRMNPTGTAWLPIMHSQRGDWQFTALYSNTARAMRAGMMMDWVVVIYQAEGYLEGRCTVVTEHHGSRTGQRIVRGLDV